ncbi:MAG: hypothetical protein H2212_07210 [Ruminococcus sp.]|nr:hypothetical protein [Ruminococcus sp.]
MSLCGFLAPDGVYTECEPWSHMETAGNLVRDLYNQDHLGGMQAEDYLYEKGYVFFYSRNAQKRFRGNVSPKIILLLSEQQKDFIINNLSNASNDSQRKDMIEILEWDADYREDSILSVMEVKLLNEQN